MPTRGVDLLMSCLSPGCHGLGEDIDRENFILILPKDLNKSTPLVGTEVSEQTSPEAAPYTKNRSEIKLPCTRKNRFMSSSHQG